MGGTEVTCSVFLRFPSCKVRMSHPDFVSFPFLLPWRKLVITGRSIQADGLLLCKLVTAIESMQLASEIVCRSLCLHTALQTHGMVSTRMLHHVAARP